MKIRQRLSYVPLVVFLGAAALTGCGGDEATPPDAAGAEPASQAAADETQPAPEQPEVPDEPAEDQVSQDVDPLEEFLDETPAAGGDRPPLADVVAGLKRTFDLTSLAAGEELGVDSTAASTCVAERVYDTMTPAGLTALAKGMSWEVKGEDFKLYGRASAECGEELRAGE